MAAINPLSTARDTSFSIPTAESNGLTPDQFLALCGDETYLELVRGEVVQLAPANFYHGRKALRAGRLLDEFAEAHDLGVVVGQDTGFILERDPYSVRAPDVAFVSKARLPEDLPERFFPGAPDLAVEILSPTDSLKAAEAKAMMYLRAGGTVVWILDPKDRSCRIYRRDESVRALGPDDEADAEPVLPGFRCPVSHLFGG
ncbi:MAG: Uma2 family endonuclease [Armatimonadetes bacterium]|nr:Uma2 family endonuclease [Armatimonadota bacterium]